MDGTGGRLFLDGAQVGSGTWTSGAGVPNSTYPLLIGRYWTAPYPFIGVIDEVTVWNTALTPTQLAAEMNTPLAGSESGLVSLWRFDEGSGTNTADATLNGNNGILYNSPVWTGSTAFLGDGTSVIHTELGNVQWARQFAVQTMPADRGFAATAPTWVRRLDDFGASAGTNSVALNLQSTLQSTLLAGPVPLVNNSMQLNLALGPYNAAAPQANAGGVVQSPVLDVEPQAGTQIDSVNDTLQLAVAESHSVNGGAVIPDETFSLAPTQLLHFDGNLFFGSIQTTFSSIANAPARGAPIGGGIATQLGINNNSGTLTSNPAFHYGDGTPLNVILVSNGDAQAAAGTTVTLNGTDTECIQNICFTRTNPTLGINSIQADISLQLPVGLSICTNFDAFNRYTVAQVNFSGTPLDINTLHPQSDPLVKSGPLYAVEETKPFWIRAPALSWQIAAGQIVIASPTGILFVRQEDDDSLTAAKASLVDTNTANRISNDGYYRNASNVLSAQITVSADANGLALMTGQFGLNPPELRPHFPYSGPADGSQIMTTVGGQLVISNALIDTVSSSLPITGTVPVTYARDCADTNCSAATISPAVLAFSVSPSQFTFTPDGGLLAYGALAAANNLTWGFAGNGNFAQQAGTVQAGAYHMPGTFLRYDQTALADVQRAAVLLFSGFGDAANPAYLERPGQDSYLDGFANYAGLNFRAPAQGSSYIAETNTGPYPLTTRSKYYARFGGVSGIHEAASFPNSLALYGYPFTFTSYRLSFLDSENWESRTDGALVLPYPAGFQQEFSRMKFVCKGDLDSAQVPPTSGAKQMAYWHTWITPQSIQFLPAANDLCGTSGRTLVLGVETKLPLLGQAFHAALGFKNNGDLATAGDPVPVVGIDSRFKVPGHLTLQGPGTSTFSLETASDGYFNNWETSGQPAAGFYNLAGKIRVPFFSDVKVHLHVTPSGPNSAQVAIMGGWPDADGNGENRGWNVGTSNYFNTATFDPHNDGWPQGIPLNAYELSPSNTYHPRAQRDWIDVAKFDYPLQWNAVLNEFAGFADAPVVLPVIDVNSRLKELSPGKIDFDFAQDITLPLPRIKVLDFANDALNELNTPILSVSNAIGGLFSTTGLTSGFRSLQGVLREDASGFFRPILQPALGNAANQIYALLAAQESNNPAAFPASIVGIVTGSAVNLQTNIQTITGLASQANTVFGQLNQTLLDADDTLGCFLNVLQKDNTGTRHIVRAIIQQLAHDQGQGVFQIPDLPDSLVDGLLADLEPTLAQVESELTDLRAQFDQLQSEVANATGDFSSALSTAANDGPALTAFVQSAGATVSNLLASVVPNNPDYFTVNPAAAQQAILDQLILAFLGSPLTGDYQQTFRQFLYDNNFALDQLMDVLFDQINRSIRDGLGNAIQGASDGVFQSMKGVGQMSQTFLSAKIRGSPTFEGDSLRHIHLDAAVQFNLPDEMHFNAYMDIKELTSQSMPLDCIPAGDPAAEVTLGAKDVPLGWLGITSAQPLTLTVEGRWTLQNGSVLGIGGLFDIKGEVGFKGCNVKEIGADFAFGAQENYFAAKAAGTITVLVVPVDVQVGIFAGHACSLDPLLFIDPNADKVLNDPGGFSGIYLQYGGGLDLAEILFGSASCWLDVRAAVTTAVFYEGGPRSGKVGFRQQDSVDLDLLCILSGHVDVALGASVTYTPPTDYEIDVTGDANVCGTIGFCPICAHGCKGITISGRVNDGHIDYSIHGP